MILQKKFVISGMTTAIAWINGTVVLANVADTLARNRNKIGPERKGIFKSSVVSLPGAIHVGLIVGNFFAGQLLPFECCYAEY
ncbi:MAG: hypothetical protein KUG79_14860 [Pseudomonadales bacterium]|nr:hypothetical protein [Pseudomonadales bacterium]